MNEQPSPSEMTGREREALAKVVRLNERVAKAAAKQRAAELKADAEEQLARRYHFDENAVWKAAAELATKAAEEATALIKAECAKLGIPPEFAPGVSSGWYSRGENDVKKRRDELRQAANARIEDTYRSALAAIGAKSAQVQTQLLIGSLTSDEARAFVESIPSPEALMPSVALLEIEGGKS